MINQENVIEALRECEDERKAIQGLVALLIDWDAEIQQMEAALQSLSFSTKLCEDFKRRFNEAVQLSFPGWEPLGTAKDSPQPSPADLRRRHGGKTDTQVIEEIFREYGPLHVNDLVPIAQARGVPFTGNKQPSQMARDKMYSCKRFVLFGNNVWGLPDQELPEKYKNRGRGNRPLKNIVHDEDEQDFIKIA